MHTNTTTTRRTFLKLTALGASTIAFPAILRSASDPNSPNSKKLNIALIGTGGRGVNMCRDMVQLADSVNIVAMADVDPARGNGGGKYIKETFPHVRQYQDYRKLLDTEKSIQAVIVTTPDHMHAPISMLAMSRGLHVFCEKPLTRTIWEARRMREVAAQNKVVTQMGNQSSIDLYLRRSVEVIRAGIIGDVTEVVVWTNRKSALPADNAPKDMPAGMDWQTWLGVTPDTPFSNRYHPGRWRWWTQYGTGALGDMGCHLTNLASRALDLYEPSAIEASVGEILAPGMFPKGAKVTYHFPELNGRKPLKMTWFDGGWLPEKQLFTDLGIEQQFKKTDGSEKIIIGTKGIIYSDKYIKLNGEEKYFGIMNHPATKSVPVTLPRSKMQGADGHYNEWIQSCLNNNPSGTYSNFGTSARQTEMILLGTIAQRTATKLTWDAQKMEFPGNPAATAMLKPLYRPGYTIPQ